MTCELVIVRGLPGSGKSQYCKTNYPDYLHYEPDHLFCDTNGIYKFDAQLWDDACKFVYSMVDFALSRKENVVVSDVFPKVLDIANYERLANYHKAKFSIITLIENYGYIHNVPMTIREKMKNIFEYMPTEKFSEVEDSDVCEEDLDPFGENVEEYQYFC